MIFFLVIINSFQYLMFYTLFNINSNSYFTSYSCYYYFFFINSSLNLKLNTLFS